VFGFVVRAQLGRRVGRRTAPCAPASFDSAIVDRVCSLRFGVQRLDSPCGAPVASPTSPQAPALLDVTLPSQGSASLFAATHTLAYRENTSASIIQREASEMDELRS
jgi:hypothetical protein